MHKERAAGQISESAVRGGLEQRTTRRVRRPAKATTSEILSALKSARASLHKTDFGNSLTQIFLSCKKLVRAASGYVALLSRDGTCLEIIYRQRGPASSAPPAVKLPLRGLLEKVCSGDTVLLRNELGTHEVSGLLSDGYSTIENIMASPILLHGRAAGIMIFVNKTGGFLEEDGEVVVAFCDLAAIALTNSRMYDELQETRRWYKTLIESATDFIYTVEVENGVAVRTKLGPSCVAVTGYPSVDFQSDPHLWSRIIHEQDREAVAGQASALFSGQNLYPLEFRIIHKNRSIRWVRGTRVPRFDTKGALIAYDGVVQDITERKFADQEREELLRELNKAFGIVSHSQKEWQQTFDCITDLISIIDKEFTIIKANRAFAATYGLHPRDVIGKKCHDLVHGCSSPVEGCPMHFSEMTAVTREIVEPGSSGIFRVSTFPYHSPAGDFIGLIHIAKDITVEKQREAQFNRAERLASLGELSAGLAHEINNPVSFILANAHLLSEIWKDVLEILGIHYEAHGDFDLGGFHYSKSAERITKLFSGVSEGAERIKDIVESLKFLTRSKMVETMNPVDIGIVIAASLESLELQISRYTDRFVTDLEEGLPHVRGNCHSLEQVIINVLTNALQSLPDKSKAVTFSAQYERDFGIVVLQITDEGVGMPPEMIEKAFTPFFTTKRDCGGIGLGLSISRSIIADHGGSLELSSKPGEGTVAMVKLPVIRTEGVERGTE